MLMNRFEMKGKEIPIGARKYILYWHEKFKQGYLPHLVPIRHGFRYD